MFLTLFLSLYFNCRSAADRVAKVTNMWRVAALAAHWYTKLLGNNRTASEVAAMPFCKY